MIRYVYANSSGVWSTDGTSAGTQILVSPGADFVPQPNTPMVTLPNGKVVFFGLVNPSQDPSAAFGPNAISYWITDGTQGGTYQTGGNSAFDGLTGGDSIVDVVAIGYEVAYTQFAYGAPLIPYATDGTSAGTVGGPYFLSNGATTGGSFPTRYIYASPDGVFSTDGTVSNNVQLQAKGPDFVPPLNTPMVTLPNGKVLFFALVDPSQDPSAAIASPVRIWETDGTVAGTVLTGVVAAPTGMLQAGDSISNVVLIGDKVAFTYNGFGGTVPIPYVTDGTTAGTAGGPAVLPATGANTGGSAPVRYVYATSAGVYATDGSSNAPVLLQATGADFVPQTNAQMVTLPNGKVMFFALVNPSLDVNAAVTSGIRYWQTDGTAAGTALTGTYPSPVGLVQAGDSISGVIAVGNEVVFTYNGGGGSVPITLATDGTMAGTTAGPQGVTATGALTCFLAGTRVATPDGEVTVESLQPGDVVTTVFGGACPVVWVGRRDIDCRRHPQPQSVWPIRIAANAFGPCCPHRPLFLSPNHAVYVDGVLIPIKHLVNGSSIARVTMDRVSYWHIELAQHDVLLAEGLAAESYLDVGDRDNFANGGDVLRLFPEFSAPPPAAAAVWEAQGCAPLVVHGPELAAARNRVNARAAAKLEPRLRSVGQRYQPA